MADWVRFHRELCLGNKRAIPRALRFVYMEISLEAKRKRGYVALPLGMDPVAAVHDRLSGDRKEIEKAVKLFTSGAEPMWRFVEEADELRLYVHEWPKWNPIDATGSERQARHRNGRRNGPEGDDNERPLRSGNVANSYSAVDVTNPSARARANLPLSLSESLSSDPEIQTGSLGSTERGEAPSETRLAVVRAPRIDNATADGCMGMAVSAFAEGVRAGTGRPFPQPQAQGDLQRLIPTIIAHCPALGGREAWAREAGRAYAVAAEAEDQKLWVIGFCDWVNDGRRFRGRKRPRADVQPLDGAEGEDWMRSGLGEGGA